jgi:hypothetical protein
MLKQVRVELDGDPSGKMETAAIKLPFDARDVWGKARVPVKLTINGYRWRSTIANMEDAILLPCFSHPISIVGYVTEGIFCQLEPGESNVPKRCCGKSIAL